MDPYYQIIFAIENLAPELPGRYCNHFVSYVIILISIVYLGNDLSVKIHNPRSNQESNSSIIFPS